MTPETCLIGARLLHYAAVLVLFGGSLFPFYALAGRAPLPEPAGRFQLRVFVAAAVLALVSGALWLAFTSATMADSMAGATDWASIKSIVADMPFGRIWAARLVLTIVVIHLTFFPVRVGWLLPIMAGVLLASIGLTGHAASEEGVVGAIHQAADAVHLLAAGAWLGALLPLGFLITKLPEAPETRTAMSRFSGVGSIAVAALILTGLLNGWLIVGSVEGLFTTTYGRLLLFKLALFGLMLLLAAYHRFRLAPALEAAAGRPEAAGRLRRSIALEQALAGAVVVVVAVLGTLDPHI
jgi:putative copper resistance protein D